VPDADRLGPQAAAALLKLVEEPRPGTRLYLTAVHPRALPPALLSRCARVGVATPEPARALAWLAARLPEADAPTHAALLELAGGRPGCALDLHAVDALDLHDGLCRAIAPIARGADAADAQRMLELAGRAATPALDGLQRLLERAARAAAGAELTPAIPGEDKLLAGLARRRGIDGLTRWWRQATARIQERDHLHLDPARALLRAATPPA
jgi:DNA polymerase-3 subunit delta'